MTVEHRHDVHREEPCAPDDPLMYALTGAPLPPELARDPAFVAEYRAAAADTAAFPDDLRLLARTLTEEPVSAPRITAAAAVDTAPRGAAFRMRRRWAMAGVAAAAAAGVVLAGLFWDGAEGGSGSPGAALSPAGRLACTEIIAEGTVVETAEPADGLVEVTLRVDRYHKPESGEPLLTFSLPEDELAAGPTAADDWAGSRALVLLPQDEGALGEVFREGGPAPDGDTPGGSGDALVWGRAMVDASLEESRGLPCPAVH
ncbi:hypothetical protein GCM10009716_07730 [Streptomyces sodiiphilus]|uniref:Anti-sigma factor n=1 Tax=Streptomyces sodiiphilus TaxID=226217 RepID=A0ABP5A4M0_9ACTN